MDDKINTERDALEWLDRRIREEVELDGEMTNEHAIELAFIQRTLERFPRRMEGNVNAIREALDKAHRVLHCAIIAGILRGDDAYDAMNMAAAALAAPPRNCDVGTADEQIARFNEFCDSEWQDSGSANCGNCPLWVSGRIGHDCQIRWGQMPYEAPEGGAHECDKAL